ncbi:MAG: hypothetical protein ABI187_03820 [Ornithinibacter sp.]
MPKGGFGSDLWKTVQAVKVSKQGGIEVPVRANSRQGIVVGVDAVAKSDAAQHAGPSSTRRTPRRVWGGFFGRR